MIIYNPSFITYIKIPIANLCCFYYYAPMKKLLIISSFLLIAACATPEQLAENKRLQQQADFDTCASYGIRPKTDMFANCLMQLDLIRQKNYHRDDDYYRPAPHIYGGMGFYRYH